jgi:undecaprenyl pyrophosphate phosphatase UppP
VVGTIPAGILGLLLKDALRHSFAQASSAAFFLLNVVRRTAVVSSTA